MHTQKSDTAPGHSAPRAHEPDTSYDFDQIVIGSGFGGSVSALRLVEKGYSVGVMEMGRRWKAEDFPKSNWDAKRYFWRPGLRMFGFFNMRLFRHVVVMCGNAVGGGSIAYASALLKPAPEVWDEGSWAGLQDWKQVMPKHYATAERMLGVADNTLLGEADRRLETMARMAGVADTFYPGRSGTFFPPAGEAGGKTYPDPYFNGEGPERSSCIGWRIGQIVIALNDEFRKHSLPEISPGTFAKYISRLLTQHRVSLYDRRKYHLGVHE